MQKNYKYDVSVEMFTPSSQTIMDKLKILSDAAKFDVSCSSSGVSRKGNGRDMGNCISAGICHSFAADGRCISLLKILLSNECIYDCKYCLNRRSNDVPRATFTPDEVCELTMNFYRRNYIEGLFLSSGIIGTPNQTMEMIWQVVYKLRNVYHFRGYIHVKGIPGADPILIQKTGYLADRMSVNLELPTADGLKKLAPNKHRKNILTPMRQIQQGIQQGRNEVAIYRHAPDFVPAGQSTQMIVGATSDSDKDILHLTSALYKRPSMKRVYYSGFVPVNGYDKRLPALKQPPLVRENRLYQADWLLRFYNFNVDEIVDDSYPDLDLEIDPKLAWALRHPEAFPVDINRADYEMLLRVPGLGVKSAKMILTARRYSRLGTSHLKQIGVVLKKAQYFITCNELPTRTINEIKPENVRRILTQRKVTRIDDGQLIIPFVY